MPRTAEANQRLREEQRAKILDGAMKVFAQKGSAATMAEIAAAAEVSQGLAYRYFANKEAIIHAVLEHVIQIGIVPFPQIIRSFLRRTSPPVQNDPPEYPKNLQQTCK